MNKRTYTPEQKLYSIEAQRRRRAKNPERVREIGRQSERRRRFRRYGITEEQYVIMWEGQKKLCGICNESTTAGHGWHIDHCHSTGKFRGILCHSCNLMIGLAKDREDILKRAIEYLKK